MKLSNVVYLFTLLILSENTTCMLRPIFSKLPHLQRTRVMRRLYSSRPSTQKDQHLQNQINELWQYLEHLEENQIRMLQWQHMYCNIPIEHSKRFDIAQKKLSGESYILEHNMHYGNRAHE